MTNKNLAFISDQDFVNPFTSVLLILGLTVLLLLAFRLLGALLFLGDEKKPLRMRPSFMLLVLSAVTVFIGVHTMRASHNIVREYHPDLLLKLEARDFGSAWNRFFGLKPLSEEQMKKAKSRVRARNISGYQDKSAMFSAKNGMSRARIYMIAGGLMFVTCLVVNAWRRGNSQQELAEDVQAEEVQSGDETKLDKAEAEQ